MNGGLENALEVDYQGARRATAGFRTLGAEAIADVVERARARSVIGFAELEGLEEHYDELAPTDATLDEL
jgi:hypothetical protein